LPRIVIGCIDFSRRIAKQQQDKLFEIRISHDLVEANELMSPNDGEGNLWAATNGEKNADLFVLPNLSI
jgi:hypothetical protein